MCHSVPSALWLDMCQVARQKSGQATGLQGLQTSICLKRRGAAVSCSLHGLACVLTLPPNTVHVGLA